MLPLAHASTSPLPLPLETPLLTLRAHRDRSRPSKAAAAATMSHPISNQFLINFGLASTIDVKQGRKEEREKGTKRRRREERIGKVEGQASY